MYIDRSCHTVANIITNASLFRGMFQILKRTDKENSFKHHFKLLETVVTLLNSRIFKTKLRVYKSPKQTLNYDLPQNVVEFAVWNIQHESPNQQNNEG